MDSYLGLFLVMIISLASIVLADVLVQPGYKYQYDNNPQYQSVPQYRIQSPAAQYHAQLSSNKHPTAIDSLHLEHEPTDTNDKRVENRQSKNYLTGSLSLGMYPEKIYPGYHQAQNMNEYIKFFSNPSMFSTLPTLPTFQENGDSAETYVSYRDPRILTSRDPIKSTSKEKEDEDEEEDEAPTGITYGRYYDNSKYRDVQAVIDKRLFKAMQNSIGYYWPKHMYFSTLNPSKPQTYSDLIILQR